VEWGLKIHQAFIRIHVDAIRTIDHTKILILASGLILKTNYDQNVSMCTCLPQPTYFTEDELEELGSKTFSIRN